MALNFLASPESSGASSRKIENIILEMFRLVSCSNYLSLIYCKQMQATFILKK